MSLTVRTGSHTPRTQAPTRWRSPRHAHPPPKWTSSSSRSAGRPVGGHGGVDRHPGRRRCRLLRRWAGGRGVDSGPNGGEQLGVGGFPFLTLGFGVGLVVYGGADPEESARRERATTRPRRAATRAPTRALTKGWAAKGRHPILLRICPRRRHSHGGSTEHSTELLVKHGVAVRTAVFGPPDSQFRPRVQPLIRVGGSAHDSVRDRDVCARSSARRLLRPSCNEVAVVGDLVFGCLRDFRGS